MTQNFIKNILQKVEENHTLDKSEIISLLKNGGNELLNAANNVRKKYLGEEIYLRALVEFSNYCYRTCYYCGLRAENKSVQRYRMTENEIVSLADKAYNRGFKTIVLQSGEDLHYSINELCKIIEKIKKNDVALTLSIGEKSFDEYKQLKSAGADRYLLRIETTNKDLYQKYHPNMSYENRLRCLEDLKSLGYEVGTGSLIGLEGQTIEMIAEDILYFKRINADMIGLGVFIPHLQTPLGQTMLGDFDLALRAVAVTRLVLPDINIPATTAMETVRENGRLMALSSGANVVMLNIADEFYKKNYNIYPQKSGINQSLEEMLTEFKISIKSMGYRISNSKGFRLASKRIT